jgi:hypothetical protein
MRAKLPKAFDRVLDTWCLDNLGQPAPESLRQQLGVELGVLLGKAIQRGRRVERKLWGRT